MIDENTAKAGKRSAVIRSKEYDDCCVYQKCACKPHTRYLLCGWVKTENVEDEHKGTREPASASAKNGTDVRGLL